MESADYLTLHKMGYTTEQIINDRQKAHARSTEGQAADKASLEREWEDYLWGVVRENTPSDPDGKAKPNEHEGAGGSGDRPGCKRSEAGNAVFSHQLVTLSQKGRFLS